MKYLVSLLLFLALLAGYNVSQKILPVGQAVPEEIPVTDIKEGVYGLSLIIRKVEFDGSFTYTTSASENNIAPVVQNFYPPMNDTGTGYTQDYALVRLVGTVRTPDADTVLFPALNKRLNLKERTDLANNLSARLGNYAFRDFNNTPRNKTLNISVGITDNSRDIVREVFAHLGHSQSRNKPQVFESHNTEYTDDFSTDPYSAPRWTNERGASAWDSTNLELDMAQSTARIGSRYSVNDPGSIEQEAQATFLHDCAFCSTAGEENGGPSVRNDSGGVDSWYWNAMDTVADNISLKTLFEGGETELATVAVTVADLDFWTIRLAAAGAAGANVELALWYTNHGASKPSDPGWIGVDGSPDLTYTDTGANRHDAADDIQGGIAVKATGVAIDTRHDFFKVRAITDRGGAATPTPDPEQDIINFE